MNQHSCHHGRRYVQHFTIGVAIHSNESSGEFNLRHKPRLYFIARVGVELKYINIARFDNASIDYFRHNYVLCAFFAHFLRSHYIQVVIHA